MGGDRQTMVGSVKDVHSKSELEELINDAKPLILHFWASWCEASIPMDKVFAHLSIDFPHLLFLRVDAEEQAEISEAYSVSAVPFFVFFKDGKKVDTLEGAHPSSLANKVSKVAGVGLPWDPASLGMEAVDNPLKLRLQELIESQPIMLFMKGNPEAPQCGFSQKVVDILNKEKVQFGTFDILSDSEVREELKMLSNCLTYPQLYCKGQLLGGLDIILEMQKSGELKKVLGGNEIIKKETLENRFRKLVSTSPVMLFMKGTPDAPQCGFSSKVVKALKEEEVEFGSFDILSDEEVRQGLKTFSNWPTFPQLYYKGELIGGCDIIMELHGSGDLKATLSE